MVHESREWNDDRPEMSVGRKERKIGEEEGQIRMDTPPPARDHAEHEKV